MSLIGCFRYSVGEQKLLGNRDRPVRRKYDAKADAFTRTKLLGKRMPQ